MFLELLFALVELFLELFLEAALEIGAEIRCFPILPGYGFCF
jgi:hypothetical protein